MTKDKKLNIAIFHLAFIYSGGGEKLVLQEYDGLKKLGHKVSIFTTVIDKKRSFPDIVNKYKIKTFIPYYKIFRGHEALVTILSCLLAPFYAFKFKKYDVILACNQPSPWIAFVISKLCDVPYISYLAQPTRFLHPRKVDMATGLFFTKKASESISARAMMTTFRKFSNWADQISVRSSKAILVNGEHIKRLIEKIYKVKVVNCPTGLKVAKNINNNRQNYLLVSNRHFPQKRLEYAIFTLNSILQIKPNYRLLITGSITNYTQVLRDLVKELGIEKHVDFLGYVDEKKITRLYKNASCYLYTAPEEDFGMGIVEAMSFGTPVVAWNSSGPSKIITNGADGYLAKPYDITDFTDKVIKVLNDKNLARKIGIQATKTVKDNFSYENHIKTIESMLKNGVS